MCCVYLLCGVFCSLFQCGQTSDPQSVFFTAFYLTRTIFWIPLQHAFNTPPPSSFIHPPPLLEGSFQGWRGCIESGPVTKTRGCLPPTPEMDENGGCHSGKITFWQKHHFDSSDKRPRFPPSVKTFISCHRTPRPWNWFLSPGKPNESWFSTPWKVFEGFLKAFWRAFEGSFGWPIQNPSKTLQRPFRNPWEGSVAGMRVLTLVPLKGVPTL